MKYIDNRNPCPVVTEPQNSVKKNAVNLKYCCGRISGDDHSIILLKKAINCQC